MGLELPFGVKVLNANQPLDDKYLFNGEPYSGVTHANTVLTSGLRHIGLTVNINNEEYWYAAGIEDSDLVEKTSSVVSGGITGATNGLTKTGNTIILGGRITGHTTIVGGGTYNMNFGIHDDEPIGQFNLQAASGIDMRTYGSNISLTSVGGMFDLNVNGDVDITTETGAISFIATGGGSDITLQTNEGNVILYGQIGDVIIKGDNGVTISGNTSFNFGGAKYAENYAEYFTDRSLVDKEYVDNIATGFEVNNGLTKSGNTVSLGGILTGDTVINGDDFTHSLIFADGNEFNVYSDSVHVSGNDNVEITGGYNLKITANDNVEISGGYNLEITGGDNVEINGGYNVEINGGDNVKITGGYNVDVSGYEITVFGESDVEIGISYGGYLKNSVHFDDDFMWIENTMGGMRLLSSNNIDITASFIEIGGGDSNNKIFSFGTNEVTGTNLENTINVSIDEITLNVSDRTQSDVFNGIEININDIKVTTVGGSGMTYVDDYSSGFTKHSIVDVNYVTGLTSNVKLNKLIINSISGNTTLTSDNHVVLVDTSLSGITVTLMANPQDGQVYHIKDMSGNALANNIIINGNGNEIDGSSTVTINTDYGSLYFVYSDIYSQWYTLAFIN